MKKVLLLDTSFSSAPIYSALVELGYDVYVCGNNPQDYLAVTVEKYCPLDYSVILNVYKLAEELAIDIVVPGCNDVSYEVCAELKKLGVYSNVDSVDVTESLASKNEFRLLLKRLNIPCPETFSTTLSEFDYPVIVKPIDAYSGRGVSVVREPKQLHASIQYAEEVSRSGRIVLEQFVEGQLCSHSAFVENGEIVWDIFVDEFCFFNPYAVDNSFVRYDFPSGLAENVRSSVSSIVSSLQVEDGLFHTQFIYDDKGFWFIEVTRRCPGDLYSRLVELSTGMPYATYYASFMVGAPFSSVVAPNKQESRKLVRHTVNLKPCQYMGALLPLSRTFLAEFIPLFGVGARDLNRTRVGVLFLEMEEGFSQSECVQLLSESRLVVKKL